MHKASNHVFVFQSDSSTTVRAGLVTATEHDPLLGLALTLGVGALCLSLDESLGGLIKGNAQ